MSFVDLRAGTLAVLLLLTTGLAAGAPEPLTYDRIALSVSVEDEVEADLLVSVLSAQREGVDAAQLAGEVNSLVDWALDEARSQAGVESETLAYTTSPVYAKSALTGWRVRQSIRLRSRDAAALSGLVGRLQERMLLESIGYEVSEERRNEAEAELVRAGVDAFKERAKLIAEQMGERDHRLVEMRVEAQGDRPTPVYPRFAGASPMAAADAAPPPPRIEAGKQTVRVDVSGIIELQVQ